MPGTPNIFSFVCLTNKTTYAPDTTIILDLEKIYCRGYNPVGTVANQNEQLAAAAAEKNISKLKFMLATASVRKISVQRICDTRNGKLDPILLHHFPCKDGYFACSGSYFHMEH